MQDIHNFSATSSEFHDKQQILYARQELGVLKHKNQHATEYCVHLQMT